MTTPQIQTAEVLSLVEYLQQVAGMDTNREGEIIKIEIALHPDYDMVIMTNEETAYFQAEPDSCHHCINDNLYRVQPPDVEERRLQHDAL